MNHTFCLDELKEFIRVKCLNSKSFDKKYEYLDEFYNDSLSWDRKLTSLNHILSRILEQFEKEGGINSNTIIEYIYNLNKMCYFLIQEGEIQFLESLFQNDRGTFLNLEEELIEAQNRISV